MNSKILFLFALFICICGNGVSSFPKESKRQVGYPGAAPAGVTDSPAEALMKLKLLTYQQKLATKQAKKQAKVAKKAQKEAAFQAYMSAVAASAMAPAPAPAGAGVGTPAMAPATTQTGVAPAPAAPVVPAMGLWKKSFILSTIATQIAAQKAAMAAAAATTAAPLPAITSEDPSETTDNSDDEETETINEIVKRYAPVLRRKFYGVPKSHDQSDEDENEEVSAEENPEEVEESNTDDIDDDDTDDEPAAYQSGSFNKFGKGPDGSPNGVGYEDAKVNQAGCSGNHIHICSGTTVYLTNPDEVTNDNPLLQNPQLKAVDAEPETEDSEEQPKKHGRKRLHSHRH